MAAVKARVFISGLVQGVFFRYYTKRQAEALGLAGWVRNLPDGRVETVFEGEENVVREMIAWCWQGVACARVKKVELSWEKPEGLAGFEIVR